MKIVKTVEFPGTPSDLVPLLERFRLSRMEGWIVKEVTYIIEHLSHLEIPNCEVWTIAKKGGDKVGSVVATKGLNDSTSIDFADGILYTRGRITLAGVGTTYGAVHREQIEPIGDDFLVLIEEIISVWEVKKIRGLSKETKIDAIEYPSSIAHFRAWMDRFLARNGTTFKGTWEGHALEFNIGYFTPARTTTREVWNVVMDRSVINGKSPGDIHFAMILATEDQPNRTIIEFIDGQCYQRTSQPIPRSSSEPPVLGNAYLATHKPIGDNFIKIAKWITDGLNENHTPSNFPQKPTTKVNDLRKRKEINLQTKPAGRKVDPWNLIAFAIMNNGEENAGIRAFNYWCEQQGIKNPGRDDRKNFKKAMKRMIGRQAE